jgi:hypothetical protein
MSRCRNLLVALIIIVSAGTAAGQAARSPFSSFGIGESFGSGMAHSQGMGGVGMSNPEYYFLNSQNPALLVFNRLTTFGAGVIGESRRQNSTELAEESGSGNLNYLTMGIPIIPGKYSNGAMRWTSSLTLMPYTRLNYQLRYKIPIIGIASNEIEVTEKGSGGINQFAWSNGVSISKSVSVGLKMAYLFSATENEYSNSLSQTNQFLVFTPNVYERTYVSDFQFTPALSVHLDSLFKNNTRLNFGLVYDIAAKLNTEFFQRSERWNGGSLIDSLTTIANAKGHINIPSVISGGISLQRVGRWTVAVDGSYGYYTQYKGLADNNPYDQDSWRVAAGFQMVPDPTSLSSYLKRVTYRTGVSLENQPFLVNGNPVKDFGITFGLSLPVSRFSSLDLALKVGKKGDKTLNTVEENYIKLYFGITFNDQWFVKRRFD